MKSDFYIDRVGKEEIKELLYTHHYLKDESKDFKSGFNYGLFKRSEWECPLRIGNCLGACIFTGLPVPEIAVGAFGLERNQQKEYTNYHVSVFIQTFKKKNIISHPGLLVVVSRGLKMMPAFLVFLATLMLITTLELYTELVILVISV